MSHHKYVLLPSDDYLNIIYTENNEEPAILKRWDLIKKVLDRPVSNASELIEAIRSYNVPFGDDGVQLKCPWKLKILGDVINGMAEEQKDEFFGDNGVLRSIINLVLTMPEVCPKIEWLPSGKEHSIKLHQMQVACILANAFLCTFPKRIRSQPSINMHAMYEGGKKSPLRYREKVKCIIHYFWRIHEKQPCGYITFYRRRIPENEFPRWEKTSVRLSGLIADINGRIEDQDNHLQMDFANRVIGGGVLSGGCVQEEIRFIICPELIAARLFCEPMADNEAIVIIGAERFCNYAGYADDFQFAGNYDDPTPFDSQQRRSTQILAVDALAFRHPLDQYREGRLLRELKKIYTGLKPIPGDEVLPLATGNWGCGVYRGDPQFKSLIQIMAASQASRKVVYFTFGDQELKRELELVHSRLIAESVTVGQLYRILVRYIKDRRKNQTVFQFVLDSLKSSVTMNSHFHFLNAEELALMESGQKRSKAVSSSSMGFKQPRREPDGERSGPLVWIEREKAGTDAELSRKFTTSLANIDNSNTKDKLNGSVSAGRISPNLFSDDDISYPSYSQDPSQTDSDEIPCTPDAKSIKCRPDKECNDKFKPKGSLFDHLRESEPQSLQPSKPCKVLPVMEIPAESSNSIPDSQSQKEQVSSVKKRFSQPTLDTFFKK